MASPWHGLYRVLDTLDKSELRAIRRRCDWCEVQPPEKAKTGFSKRIRNSAKKSVEDGDYTFEEIVRQIHDEIFRESPYLPETRIKHILKDTPVCGDERPREVMVSMQMYGALRNEFGNDYKVYREHRIHDHTRTRFDLYIEHVPSSRCWLIESKIAGNLSKNKVLGQIYKYNRLIDEETEKDRAQTFLFVLADDEDEWWGEIAQDSDRTLSDCFELSDNLEEEVEKQSKTKVIKRVLDEELI
ncbi:hypothetical protein [Natronolimnohabitans innermongolicus]|uniref:Uncharacterized protein n=1 Tax=Natronolimnohabitans innermongolicus JCM 12255 TaxID=1227499 RepID=L9X9L2_9EURY|nr:hypothetical protein [Natronolimnohabitans innermongolicus]ELY58297.1 hypothetical protein C493_06969 [Natronolimnohabitans innermongolicus JCM 12255]